MGQSILSVRTSDVLQFSNHSSLKLHSQLMRRQRVSVGRNTAFPEPMAEDKEDRFEPDEDTRSEAYRKLKIKHWGYARPKFSLQ
jgi:hypothetical protein